ncbi:HlyD family secretion protein [Breoghania corrubedonensis]|uniref:HlyD family secretion protein n=1 Tax=Breoghania corrubedonensis TaxID=665038 RepID=UPI001FE28C92|nr:HlyD family secretion protein [Breoghania corrubedonensis]
MAYRTDRSTPSAVKGAVADSPQEAERLVRDTAESRQDAPVAGSEAKSGKASGKAEAKTDRGSSDGEPPVKAGTSPARSGTGGPRSRRGGKARLVLLVLLACGIGFGSYEGYSWWAHGRFFETTDDAYVSADITTILSKVSGHVAAVEVDDNQTVKAGDVLVRLDDGDYRLAVRSAEDGIASAKATVERIDRQIDAGRASVEQAKASVDAAAARFDMARTDYERQKRLVATNTTSQSTLDSAQADLKESRANVASAKAAVTLAQANIDVLKAQRAEAVQAVQTAETSLAKAQRDLGFTVIRAPVDGVVGNRAAEVGSYLQAGSRIAAMVPLEKVYVNANFKETQLEGIEPGARVDIDVDAFPGEAIHGTVESISPATGAVFSLLPPENATGNFTKVVQRVPVRIAVSRAEAERGHLRAGMSVEASVDTRTGSAPGSAATAALH